ncbi:MAG: homocysteine S-methyltransferase family protein [Solirubrobacteraceae bacterium]
MDERMIDRFRRRLSDGHVVVIDGGTGTELEARGVPMHGAVWSALAVLDHHEIVRGVHEDYVSAGAEVIIANTFTANRLALEPVGFGGRVAEINRRAVEAARQARENAADRDVLIAGSLTPHSTDGVPATQPGRDRVIACFREQVAVQAEAGVDLFALEMVPSAWYGSAALHAASESGLPVWLGLTAPSSPDLDETLTTLVESLVCPAVTAVNVMHTAVDAVEPAVNAIQGCWSGVMGAYAHHGTWAPPHWIFGEISAEAYAAAALGWAQRGVQIIGGCCGIRPAHIRMLSEQLPSQIPKVARVGLNLDVNPTP